MPIRPVRPSAVNADGSPRPVLDDRRQIEEVQNWMRSNTAVLPGDQIKSARTDRQQYRLGEGEYKPVGPASTVRVDTVGNGTGTVITPNQVIATPVAFYQGVRFTGTITVPATSVLQLVGCEVTAEITVAVGGKLHAIGCTFTDGGFVNNAGAAVDAYIIGCHKTSTAAHVNVTIIAQST